MIEIKKNEKNPTTVFVLIYVNKTNKREREKGDIMKFIFNASRPWLPFSLLFKTRFLLSTEQM